MIISRNSHKKQYPFKTYLRNNLPMEIRTKSILFASQVNHFQFFLKIPSRYLLMFIGDTWALQQRTHETFSWQEETNWIQLTSFRFHSKNGFWPTENTFHIILPKDHTSLAWVKGPRSNISRAVQGVKSLWI